MNYRYRALSTEGGTVSGTITGENPRVAARALRRQGLNVVGLEPATERASGRAVRRNATVQEVLMALHQLATLLEAEVALEEAVDALAESAGHPALARTFADIAGALRRGEPFSRALTAHGLRLPAYFQPLAEAGELTGKLAESMRDGVTQWEYDIRTANELRNALTYPAILVVSGVSAVLLIFVLVVPKFVNLLDKARGEVPLLAQLVLGMGRFFNEHVLLLGTVGVGLCVGAGFFLSRPDLRRRAWDLLATLPVLRDWLLEADVGRWSAMLSTLLENRVPLLRALELAQRNVKVSALRSRLTLAAKSVRGGVALADALQEVGAITASGYNLVRVGERSGELARMLRSLASLYAESGRNRMKRFLLLLEPAAILLIGAIIGTIMAGIILAITSVNDISL